MRKYFVSKKTFFVYQKKKIDFEHSSNMNYMLLTK